jgi:hypothetical protein
MLKRLAVLGLFVALVHAQPASAQGTSGKRAKGTAPAAAAPAAAEPAPAAPAAAAPAAEPTPSAEPATSEAPAEPAASTEESASFALDDDDLVESAEDEEGGALLLGGKLGGIASFNGLDPFLQGAIEAGWVFSAMERSFAATLQVEYTAPSASGNQSESFDPERVPGGGYSWELRQKELVFAPTFLYRMTFLRGSGFVPYAGIGPRIYLLESVVRGEADGEKIADTQERSTKFGFGIPVGAELALGPGSLTGELLFQWGPFDHSATGSTHLGGASLLIGYRLLLDL